MSDKKEKSRKMWLKDSESDSFGIVLEKTDTSIVFVNKNDVHATPYHEFWEEKWFDFLEDTLSDSIYYTYSVKANFYGFYYGFNMKVDNYEFLILYKVEKEGFIPTVNVKKDDSYVYFLTLDELDELPRDYIHKVMEASKRYFQSLPEYRLRFLTGVYQMHNI